jgi:carboxyl-terminal processing protease
LNEEDYQALQDISNGEFGGIGIEITQSHGLIQVITPIDDTPAFKAGIKPGDLIVRINDLSVQGMGVEQAIKQMRGDAGTEVTIVVLRKGENKPLTFVLKRAIIKIDSVKSKLLDGDYGYIRISNFEAETGQDVATAIRSLQKDSHGQLKGIIVDLRDNPGGLLDSSIDTANDFLDKDEAKYGKKVVYTQGRIPEMDYTGYVTGRDLTQGLPMVVLINEGTASAAEIVAAALQDQGRAIVVGTRSFGKGSVQTVVPLPPDKKTAIKLTTALYYTPSGRSIQAEGVVPDVQVDELVIPKSVQPEPSFFGTEADLQGHLQQPGTNNKSLAPANSKVITEKGEKTDTNAQDTALMQQVFSDSQEQQTSLLYQDYQLYQALNILKAMSVLEADQSNRKQ